jgi:DNA primase
MNFSFLENTVYPALYEHITEAFPEFGFKTTSFGFRSSTGYKIDHTSGEKGKVYLYKNNISHFIDYTRGSISIWKYLQTRDNLSHQETLILLTSLAKINTKDLPNAELWSAQELNFEILEAANTFFIQSLSLKSNSFANTPKAAEIRSYLTDTRKYSIEDLLLPDEITHHDLSSIKMELGFIPDKAAIYKHLIETCKYEDTNVYAALKLPNGAGSSHHLTIPFRNHSGNILGFVFRNIESSKNTQSSKYLYSPELKKDDTVFNFSATKGEKDLTIVEGLLDSLLATSRGLVNVVALGGITLNEIQLKKVIEAGVTRITLCLDNDKSGKEATEKIIKLIQSESSIKCFVASVPPPFKDPDEWIVKEGIEPFKREISNAIPFYIYQLNKAFDEYPKKPTWKDTDNLLEKAVQIAGGIVNNTDRDIFIYTFLEHTKSLGISKKSLELTIDSLKSVEENEKHKKALISILKATEYTIKNNEPLVDAVGQLESKLSKLKYADIKSSKADFLQITTEDDIRKKISTQPENIRSGYLFRENNGHTGYDELLIPAGAISVIAARTSHGKTAMLMNLAMNVCLAHPDKKVYFLSLEEDKEAILMKMLNIFIDKELKSGAKNIKYIRNFFRTNGSTYHNPEFLQSKDAFFNELIYSGRLNVHYAPTDADELTATIKYVHEQRNIGAVFIDYIQLLNLKQSFQSRQLELQAICNKLLKDLAVPTGLPIVMGAQFNREVFEEGMMDATKIREAGDIEQTANMVIGLWNKAFTNESKHKDKRGNQAKHNPNELFLEVLKNRDGQAGLITELHFNGNTGKISNTYNELIG